MSAHALTARGRFLDQFDALTDAALDGTLSAGQIAAISAVCSPPVEPVMRLQQADLVATIAPLSVADTVRVAAAWRQRAEVLVDMPAPDEAERELQLAHTRGGLVGRFVLADLGALELEQAIRTASTASGHDDRSPRRRNADALVEVVSFYNANHDRPGTPRRRPHIELYVDAEHLATSPLSWTPERADLRPVARDVLLCDSVIHRVSHAGDAVLAYGRATRAVPADLFRAVAARDGGCRFPGCDRNVRHCDAHHIRYWRNMGSTDLDNLMLLCSRHHHLVHLNNWQLKLLPSCEVEVTYHDGRTAVSRPRAHPPRSP
jgi:hypothetical protein